MIAKHIALVKNYLSFLRFVFLLIPLLFLQQEGKALTISRIDQTWCQASYPSTYISGSIVLTETTAKEFTKGQSNRSLIISLPTGFQFNTTAGTYSVTGTSTNDITAISVSAITTSSITIRVTTSAATQIDMNTVTISCQVRASATNSTGIIYRSGGTLKINRSTASPSSSTSMGNLTANTAMAYTSSTCAHSNTTAAPQATSDVEILQVQVVMAGTCNLVNLTSMSFNTDGGNSTGTNNPGTNISTAKVYYTGTSGTFSPTGTFGTVSAPSGAFTVNGSQVLANGTNYFWLVYDVPSGAIAGEKLDASCSSITISGGIGAKTPTATSPTGSRTISGTSQFYSRGSGNWSDNSNWSLTDGGASCTCTPTAAGNVFINTNHSVA